VLSNLYRGPPRSDCPPNKRGREHAREHCQQRLLRPTPSLISHLLYRRPFQHGSSAQNCSIDPRNPVLRTAFPILAVRSSAFPSPLARAIGLGLPGRNLLQGTKEANLSLCSRCSLLAPDDRTIEDLANSSFKTAEEDFFVKFSRGFYRRPLSSISRVSRYPHRESNRAKGVSLSLSLSLSLSRCRFIE
jgi:hypothetical protein